MMNRILEYLDFLYPNPKCELDYSKDYELLIAIVLSAQTTDKRVNKVTKVLFNKYSSLLDLSKADIASIEDIIREIGTFRRKSIYVRDIAKKLVDDGYDYVPNDRKYIENLPGVGRKTANVFLSNIYDVDAIAVDTHVSRVSKRLGLVSKCDDVNKIEKKLEKKIPKDRWGKTHHQLVLFGRYYCKAMKPLCDECRIRDICKYKEK
jgi:endonuclease-3